MNFHPKQPKRGRSKPIALGDILPKTIKQQGMERDFFQYKIYALWNKVVGEAIARHAQPTRFAGGILHVVVKHSSWVQELQYMKEDITERLNREIIRLMEDEPDQLPIYFSKIKKPAVFCREVT